MSRSTLKPKGAAQITGRDILSAGSSFLKGVGGVAATLLNTTSVQAGQLSPEQQREEMRSHGDLSKEEFDKINASQDGGELPTIEQSSKPKGAAQMLPSIKLDLAGIIETPTPIAVVKNKYQVEGNEDADIHGYSGGEKPDVFHMNKVRKNIAGMNAMEQGTVTNSPTANAPAAGYHSNLGQPSKTQGTPGNTKMQDFRAKGEAIINKAKKEGRMLSEIEQMKVKRMRRKYENEYKKSK